MQTVAIPENVQLERLNLQVNPPGPNRKIVNPYWDSEARTCIRCEFHYPDGRVLSAAVNKTDSSNPDADNPDWTEILSQFTPAQIEKYTRGMKQKIEDQRRAEALARAKWEEEQTRQYVYDVKLTALEDVPEIKNSKNQALKKRLRKAKTLVEVFAYSTMIIQDSLSSSQ